MYDVKSVTSERPTDCGPTCLKMLLSYYGTEIDLLQLIEECGVGLTGCTGMDLKKVAKLHGMDLRGFECTGADIEDDVIFADRPSICWWRYNHFIICCGADENGRVVICDPDRGRYRMSRALFRSWFSGIAFFNGKPEDINEDHAAMLETYWPF